MAIGKVRLTSAPQRSQSPRVSPNAFGAGVATALGGLARSTEDYERSIEALSVAQQERTEKAEGFGSEEAYIRWQGDERRAQVETVQNAPENGNGLTNARSAALEESRLAFIESLPESQRDKYGALSLQAVENLTTDTFSTEFKLRNEYELKTVEDMVGTLSSDIIAGGSDAEGSMITIDELLNSTNLPEASRTALREAALGDILAAEFQVELVAAQTSNAPVGPADGKNPVAPGLAPWQRAFLNTTAKPESGGDYTVRYNGHGNAPAHFEDFSDHPRVFVRRPDGRVSSAAGRYQFTATEWDRVSGILGLEDFSPLNQDRAALYLAEERFNAQLGAGEMTFKEIMTKGTTEQLLSVKSALAPTWEGFENMSDQDFLNTFRGSQGLAGGGTGSSAVPTVWDNPRYEGLSFEQKMAMADAAAQTSNNIAEQAAQQKEAFALQLETAIAAGQAGENDVNQAIADGRVPASKAPALLRSVADEREARVAAQQFGANMTAGTVMTNDADTQAAALKYFTDRGVVGGLSQADPNAQLTFTQAFARTGVLPPEISNMLGNMINSADPNMVAYGLDTLNQMKARNPNAFESGVGKDLSETTAAWAMIRKYTPNGDMNAATARFNEWRDPAQRAMREAFKEEANDTLAELTNDDLLSDLSGSFMEKLGARLSTEVDLPELPNNPAALAMLRQDYSALYREYYSLFGDEEQTREFVSEQMSLNWGTDVSGGGNTLTYLSPTSPRAGYQPIAGSFDWIRDDIITSFELEPDAQFELMADGQSEADIAAGKPASYVMMEQNTQGQFIPRTDDAGNIIRIRPTPSQNLVDLSEARLQSTHILERIDRNQARIRELQVLEPDPDNSPEVQSLTTENDTLSSQLEEVNDKVAAGGETRTEVRSRLNRWIELQSRFKTGPNPERNSSYQRFQTLIDREQALLESME